jgi:hypothetical protein
MGKRGSDPKPIDVTQPSDLPSVDLDPITPVPVDVHKPPQPDVSVGFFEKLWAVIDGSLTKLAEKGGIDLVKLVNLPDLWIKVLILAIILVVAVGIPLIILKAC